MYYKESNSGSPKGIKADWPPYADAAPAGRSAAEAISWVALPSERSRLWACLVDAERTVSFNFAPSSVADGVRGSAPAIQTSGQMLRQ